MLYKVWVDNDEEWAEDTVSKPDIVVDAATDVDAAIEARDKITGRHHGALKFIVEPVERSVQAFYRIELEMRPYVVGITPLKLHTLRDQPAASPDPAIASASWRTRVSKGGRR